MPRVTIRRVSLGMGAASEDAMLRAIPTEMMIVEVGVIVRMVRMNVEM
jgi:hypothetical protein